MKTSATRERIRGTRKIVLSLNFRAGDNLIHEHYERFHVMRMLQHVGGRNVDFDRFHHRLLSRKEKRFSRTTSLRTNFDSNDEKCIV